MGGDYMISGRFIGHFDGFLNTSFWFLVAFIFYFIFKYHFLVFLIECIGVCPLRRRARIVAVLTHSTQIMLLIAIIPAGNFCPDLRSEPRRGGPWEIFFGFFFFSIFFSIFKNLFCFFPLECLEVLVWRDSNYLRSNVFIAVALRPFLLKWIIKCNNLREEWFVCVYHPLRFGGDKKRNNDLMASSDQSRTRRIWTHAFHGPVACPTRSFTSLLPHTTQSTRSQSVIYDAVPTSLETIFQNFITQNLVRHFLGKCCHYSKDV